MSYTDEDARPDIPAEALEAARWAYAEFEGERCDAVDAAIRAAYAAGHAAGRLLPLEAETRTEWGVRVDEPHPRRKEKRGEIMTHLCEETVRHAPKIWEGWTVVKRTVAESPWAVSDGG